MVSIVTKRSILDRNSSSQFYGWPTMYNGGKNNETVTATIPQRNEKTQDISIEFEKKIDRTRNDRDP